MFSAYPVPRAGCLDTALRSDGSLREPWPVLLRELAQLGDAEFARRQELALRLVRENAATDVLATAGDGHRPWRLDPVPELLPADEFDDLARGLAQRALLLDLVLADCYGPRHLMREGLIPPAAVFAHPGFLRPCQDVKPLGGRWLHLYACDLARTPAGWRVLADRTQAPAGAGYALENRIALGRAFPEAFAAIKAQRLAGFFAALRRQLAGLCPRRTGNPRVVLLTPGPYSATAFEHAWLARYLGFALVEGGDLTVRDDRVWLKTLGGLHQVDVILRRLDDAWCDPLELRAESALGLPGLVEAVRAGTVAVANALGSGLVENHALVPFLPRICRHLLGEELLLPSVPTLWAAEDGERIAGEFERFVLRPAFSGRGEVIFAADLSASQRAEWLARLRQDPHAHVAQERLDLATAPCWSSDGRLHPEPCTLRAFACASGDAYAVMPGGLARVAASSGDDPQARLSKDVWVPARGEPEQISLLPPPGAALTLQRGAVQLPSRVADNLFWFGRYAERAENLARLLRVGIQRLADDPASAESPELHCVGAVLERFGHAAILPQVWIATLLAGGTSSSGLPALIGHLHRIGIALRDRLSGDAWRLLAALAGEQRERLAAVVSPAAALDALDGLIIRLAALAGLSQESTTRGMGWRFLDLGRRLERAGAVLDLIAAGFAAHRGESGLEIALAVADSGITYRGRYLAALQAGPALDLLLTDASNPRSALFQAEAILSHVAELPQSAADPLPSTEERLALRLATALRLADPLTLAGDDAALMGFLAERLGEGEALCESLTRTYLAHLSPRSATA